MGWLKKIKAIIDNMEDYKAQAQVNRNVLDDPRLTDWWDGAYHTTRDWLKDVQQLYIDVAEVTPTGYDVYCAQDAPAFATWERVAASVKDVNFVSELLDGAEDWASDIQWDNDEYTEARLVSNQYPRIHRQPVLRRYRILPAGSPAPEGGAQ